jgi:hypothetical protein
MKTGIVHDGGSSELASGSAALGSYQMDALSQKKHELEAFRLFVGAVQDYAIFLLDNGGGVKSWNLRASISQSSTRRKTNDPVRPRGNWMSLSKTGASRTKDGAFAKMGRGFGRM